MSRTDWNFQTTINAYLGTLFETTEQRQKDLEYILMRKTENWQMKLEFKIVVSSMRIIKQDSRTKGFI